MATIVQQRLVDPGICSACYSCHEVCPTGAVVITNRRVAIDPELCRLCGDCVDVCSSGAIEVVRLVPADATFSLDEQLSWDSLPPEELAE